VHPLGCAIVDDRGRTVVHRRNPLGIDFLAVPAAEIDSEPDRRFTVLGEVELRPPVLPADEACPGGRYDGDLP